MRAAAERDRNLRLVGGRNVQNAARAAGAKRYVVQSTGFFYGLGTYHDPKDGSVSVQVREQSYPVIGWGRSVSSFVHVEDAAAVTPLMLKTPANPCCLAFLIMVRGAGALSIDYMVFSRNFGRNRERQ